MPRNSGGTYSLPAGNPVVTGTAVSSTVQNNTMNDISTEITNSLSRSNKGAMLAQLQLFAGTVGVPGLVFESDTDMGFYYVSAGIARFAVAGVEVLEFAANKSKISGTAPAFQWNESDAAANNKLWNAIATGEEFKLQVLTDALSATDFMTVTRTAGVVDSINLVATAVQANGSAVATTAALASYLPLAGGTVTGATTFTFASGCLVLSNADPLIWFYESGVTADNGKWSIRANSENFSFTAWNDAQGALQNWLSVSRTGQTIDSVSIVATTTDFTGSLRVTSGSSQILLYDTNGPDPLDFTLFDFDGGSFYIYGWDNSAAAYRLALAINATSGLTTVGNATGGVTLTGAVICTSTLDLGNADTTFARIAAGRVSLEGVEIGFKGIPQNAQTGNYTCVLTDAGKHIYHASGAGAGDVYTIPANSSVAYDIGTVLTFVNLDGTNTVSIAITTDTMYLAGPGTTGSRTLGTYGVATAIKIDTTAWIISGTDLT